MFVLSRNQSFKIAVRFAFAVFVSVIFGIANAATVTVQVGPNGTMSYSPKNLTISVGDTVHWMWAGSPHSVTAGTFSAPTPQVFDSGQHDQGFSFSQTFSNAGTFPYYCTVHGAAMTGTITVSSPTPTPTPTPSPTPPLPRISKGPVRIELQQVASGLTAPVELVSANDGSGRLFVAQQTGQILILQNGQVGATPFLDISGGLVPLMASYDERGLLGLAFHPGFGDSSSVGYRKLYTYSSEPTAGAADFTVPDNAAFNHQSVIAEWQVSTNDPDSIDLTSRREVMRIDEPEFNHNGGKLAFRATDKYLYISLGDGGAANDVGNGHAVSTGNAQILTTVLGKILRIDPVDPALTPASADAMSANGKYRVPTSNPFVTNSPAGTVAEIFAYGLRNPFRFSFDIATDNFFVGDVGQNNIEEVDLVQAGKNYGWNHKEGSFLFNPADGTIASDSSPDPSLTDPLAEYSHFDGQAVIGGFAYRSAAVPALTGKYFFGDLGGSDTDGGPVTGRLFYLDDPNSTIRQVILGNDNRSLGLYLKGFGEDDSASVANPAGIDGSIYVLADSNIGPSGTGGQILKVISAPAIPSLLNLSTRLNVGTNENVLIGGFILTGSTPKKVMLRGIGPSLSSGGQPVTGRLADPTLTLSDANSNALATNDDWMSSAQAQEISDTQIAPTDPKESAIIATLQPGNYTAILSGVGNTTGIGLVELYDLEQNMPANVVNISTRGSVQTGDNVMIGGFIVGGANGDTSRVFVRAIGPSLTARGVAGALQDPMLELHDSSGNAIATNDNWRSDHEADITATGIAPSDDRESAILSTLAPGNYTAIVRGVNSTTGVALVEAYQLPPATP